MKKLELVITDGVLEILSWVTFFEATQQSDEVISILDCQLTPLIAYQHLILL
jgi:hypothetical protein